MWFLALAAISGLMTADSQRRAGKFNAAQMRYNAQLAEAQAQDAIRRGSEEQAGVRRRGRLMVGAQRAGLAGQGVDVNTGSAADIQLDTEKWTEVDATTVANNAAREAWGYRMDASNSRRQASVTTTEANNQALGTLITTGANIYGSATRAKA